jgi:acyl carrier protein
MTDEQQKYDSIIAVVQRVLRVQDLDVRSDFFDLGASSLAIMQIVDLVRSECDTDVSVTDAFDAPDIESFALTAVGSTA